MVLTTHAITGAAIASTMPSHPVLGFAAGFASHFLLDAIPHWDYHLNSYKKNESNPMNSNITLNKEFIADLFKIVLDFILGIAIVLFLFGFPNFNLHSIFSSAILWGMAGGLAPDALQFVYFKWKHEPVKSLQRFHFWIHTKNKLGKYPFSGITLQVIFIILVVAIFKLVF